MSASKKKSKNKSSLYEIRPDTKLLNSVTDRYFLRTKDIVSKFGDIEVKYAIFMRRPVLSAISPAVDWLKAIIKERNSNVTITRLFNEGEYVGAGEPLVYISGPMSNLVDLETALLQKIGATCVAAYNAKSMVLSLPKTSFLAMDARHCAGIDMTDLMAGGASIGSNAAKKENGAKGFVGL